MTLGINRDSLSGAIQSNYAATGAKRYGAAGLGAATTGAVDPRGYQDREMRRKARRRAIDLRMQQQSQSSLSTPLGGQIY